MQRIDDIWQQKPSFYPQKTSSFLQQHLHLRHGLISSVFAVSPTWVGYLRVTKENMRQVTIVGYQKRKMISMQFMWWSLEASNLASSLAVGLVYWGASLAVDKHWKAVADSNHVWADAYVWISKSQWFGDVWNETNSVNDSMPRKDKVAKVSKEWVGDALQVVFYVDVLFALGWSPFAQKGR